MGLGHNDPWVESHIRPQQMWAQRSSRGQYLWFKFLQKWSLTVSTYFDVFSGETRGSRTTLFFESRYFLTSNHNLWDSCLFSLMQPLCVFLWLRMCTHWKLECPLGGSAQGMMFIVTGVIENMRLK